MKMSLLIKLKMLTHGKSHNVLANIALLGMWMRYTCSITRILYKWHDALVRSQLKKKTLAKDELTFFKNTDSSFPNFWFVLLRKIHISLHFFFCFSGIILGSSFQLSINDFLLKTSLNERSRILVGPCCATANLEARWCKHSGNQGPEHSIPKISIDLRGGLLQVCGNWQYFSQKFLCHLCPFFELFH